ncbi:MAG: hypothetical protein AVDCRST_MAG56-5930, partial [uncultured Cytophagales bacterium]
APFAVFLCVPAPAALRFCAFCAAEAPLRDILPPWQTFFPV